LAEARHGTEATKFARGTKRWFMAGDRQTSGATSGTRTEPTELFRLLVEAAPNAMLMADREGRITLVNRRTEELFGYSREELLGQPVEALVPVRVRAHHNEYVRTFFSTPLARAMGAGRDLYGLRKDGSDVPVEIGLNPIETPEGLGTLASIIDITERKQAEERVRQSIANLVQAEQALERKAAELAAANQELERSNTALDEFAYVASHDLRAPLRDIDNLAQWIGEDVGDALPEKSARHFRTLQGRIRRMENLLEDLLQYSRAGRIFGEPTEVEIRDVLHNVIELIAPPKGFTIRLEEPLPSVRTPRAPVEQIFRNLIGNAIKHHHHDRGTVWVRAADHSDFVELSVEDDGPGIPPDLHERAFAMFQTLRPRDEVEGTGMGLALVKRLVEAHGGTIHIQARRPSGAVFRFTWPKIWSR
jgi:PAS domain S-box-containing protein